MSRRRPVLAVAVDCETCDQVGGLLSEYGVELEVLESDDGEDVLEAIADLGPSLLIVGAEAGGGVGGFGVISRVRRARTSSLRILLVTNSLSAAELDLHVKQRYHADAVLDRSACDDDEIVALLRQLKVLPARLRNRRRPLDKKQGGWSRREDRPAPEGSAPPAVLQSYQALAALQPHRG